MKLLSDKLWTLPCELYPVNSILWTL